MRKACEMVLQVLEAGMTGLEMLREVAEKHFKSRDLMEWRWTNDY